MPSEELRKRAFAAVRARAEAFRSALAVTADQLRDRLGRLDAARAGSEGTAAELGQFARGRINAARLLAVTSPVSPVDREHETAVTAALAALSELEARGDALFHLRVPEGGDLLQAVDAALATAGRAFAAARIVTSADSGEADRRAAPPLAFRHWTRAERLLAPPLVIEVQGADLVPGGLAAYLDGVQSFVLIVEGPAPPAPLARLLGPGIFVLQTADPDGLGLPAGYSGPAVLALMPEGSAAFSHHPGTSGKARLEIAELPEPPFAPLRSLSSFQQEQDVALLRATAQALAPAGSAPSREDEPGPGAEETAPQASASGTPPAVDPVEALASWLLANAELDDL